jgi:hypothetical protein
MRFTAGARPGHYEILSLLGSGGMEEVYRAIAAGYVVTIPVGGR